MQNPTFSQEQIDSDPVLSGMIRDRLSLTRDNYIIRNWGDAPTEWTAELESELPTQFQDWTRFEDPKA